ncbi:uncharacterized protein N7483_009981 [Penicillium malachiteum]|uniref:uncharacterized protein n=1 Tax=Penicillium malachiteum TaxID=1324776 RepID=UPI00254708FA|nr:uncharacterized protein N7483_009981 [Penicillium malachiteum]KAJ5718899.1 hypothetical protein N7483_009981 [Penicillium malachiteum]
MARVLLWVPSDDPATLFYHLCDPNSEMVDREQHSLQQPIISIARLLCLCLMGISSPTRSQTQAGCTPSNAARQRTPSPDSSGSDSNQATARKRGFSQVASSPSTQRVARQRESSNNQNNQARHREAQFCSQRCLMGLQAGDNLDEACPNHLITSENLVLCLKAEFDEKIDRCIPIGGCGSYGAQFILTYLEYGYTVIGKGTTSDLWDRVSREVQVYQILRKAQGSAVPVSLGTIDLAKTYHLDGAGPIRHMLVMGFAGERTATMDLTPEL